MVEITGRDFNKEVMESRLPVFVCFITGWCHSCFPTCLFAKEIAREYEGRVKFLKMDKEVSPDIAERYDIIAVPTILLFNNSKELKRLLGLQDGRALRKLLDSVIGDERVKVDKGNYAGSPYYEGGYEEMKMTPSSYRKGIKESG